MEVCRSVCVSQISQHMYACENLNTQQVEQACLHSCIEHQPMRRSVYICRRYISRHTCTDTYASIHTYIHTCMHTYIHTCIRTQRRTYIHAAQNDVCVCTCWRRHQTRRQTHLRPEDRCSQNQRNPTVDSSCTPTASRSLLRHSGALQTGDDLRIQRRLRKLSGLSSP